MGYGVAGIVGNFLAGSRAASHLRGTLLVICAGIAAATALPGVGEAASSLFVAAFNLSIALGALIGGATVDGIATTGVLWVAGALALLAAATADGHRTPL